MSENNHRGSTEHLREDLRDELADLEAEEERVSAERRRLQLQIDNGFATARTHERERETSNRRHELHERIDALREALGLPTGPQQTSEGLLEKASPAFGSLRE